MTLLCCQTSGPLLELFVVVFSVKGLKRQLMADLGVCLRLASRIRTAAFFKLSFDGAIFCVWIGVAQRMCRGEL